MGGGQYSHDTYRNTQQHKAANTIPDFQYSKTHQQTHPDLDPMRINQKASGLKKLESRDSVEHPESNPFLICFDVTGSNIQNAMVAQKQFPKLMTLLTKYIADPQISVAANDDENVAPGRAVQISEFESDNTIDTHYDHVDLVGNGGGNGGESYDLLLYAAARKVVTDSFEVRNKKGYLFMYADERFFPSVLKAQVKAVFGDVIEKDIPIGDIVDEVKQKWNVFILCPESSRSTHDSFQQYRDLFGEDSVVMLEDPNMICEQIAALVGLNEEKTDANTAVQDLVAVGVGASAAQSLVHSSLKTIASTKSAKASGTLPVVGKGGASRL